MQKEQAKYLLSEFVATVPSLRAPEESDQLLAGKLALALELVRSLDEFDLQTTDGNLVEVLIKGAAQEPYFACVALYFSFLPYTHPPTNTPDDSPA